MSVFQYLLILVLTFLALMALCMVIVAFQEWRHQRRLASLSTRSVGHPARPAGLVDRDSEGS